MAPSGTRHPGNGDRQLASTARSRQNEVQIENPTGARFQHFTDMMKLENNISNVSEYSIFSVGFFDKSSKASCSKNCVSDDSGNKDVTLILQYISPTLSFPDFCLGQTKAVAS